MGVEKNFDLNLFLAVFLALFRLAIVLLMEVSALICLLTGIYCWNIFLDGTVCRHEKRSLLLFFFAFG